MQLPIVSGIFADTSPDLRTSYPVNQLVVPMSSGASAVYLRPADGIVGNGTGPGTDRGGINWNGVCYRVMGSKLVTVSSTGTVTVLGDVGNDGEQVTLDYSFDLLGIASNGNLFFWDPVAATLTQNTDPDLGVGAGCRVGRRLLDDHGRRVSGGHGPDQPALGGPVQVRQQ
jgi:hypothetical protein